MKKPLSVVEKFSMKDIIVTLLLHNWILTGKIVHVSIIIGPLVCASVKNDIHALSGHSSWH